MAGRADKLSSWLQPREEDSADLRWALETALAMWARGDRQQALRWTHSAVQTATSEGRHDRAYSLGRALGEMEAKVAVVAAVPGSMPVVLAPGPPSEHTAPLIEAPQTPVMARSRKPARKSMMQTAPYKIPPDEVTHLLEPDSKLIAACQPSQVSPGPAHALPESEPPPARRVPERPRPPEIRKDPLDATLTDVRPAGAPVSGRDPKERTMVMDAAELGVPSVSRAQASGPPTTLGSRQAVLEPMHALRVSVQSGAGREIVLRLLHEDEALPEGAQEAVLVPLPFKD